MPLSQDTLRFIREHRRDDVRSLALQARRYPSVDMPAAITQISGWQIAKEKIPTWAENEHILYPKRLRAIKMTSKKPPKNYDAKVKLAFSAILCAVLCFLFPVASPLFFSLFLGVAVRESGMKHIYDFVSGPLLYGSTFMLGLLLGVLCDAHLLLDPKILKLLVLGMGALLLSGIGGIIGGYIMYFIKRGNYNPVIGIAAVSCVPTTAKVAQKIVSKDNPNSFILGDALGANISGVITSAIITGIYITIIPYL